MPPYYVIMRFLGETEDEFLLLSPFTPSGNKKNMVALLAARCDGAGYGKLVLYRFPSSRIVYGPSRSARASSRTAGSAPACRSGTSRAAAF